MSHKRVIDVDLLRSLVEDQKATQNRVEEVMGIPAKKVSKFCKRYGIQSQRTGPRSGEGHPCWKGGTYLLKGYRQIYSPDHPNKTKQGYVAEHRLVMEAKLNRLLDRREVVHHIDGNPLNNHPENLMVFQTNSAHLAVDLKGKIPNWSDQGKAEISAANKGMTNAEKSRMSQQLKAIRALLKSGDGLPLE